MQYSPTIHNYSHLVKAIFGQAFSVLNPSPPNSVIVLNYHGTPKKFHFDFKRQLEFYQENFEIISPAQFKNLANSQTEITGRKLLLTFDDGIRNNQYAIEELDRLGISAYFFIVPEFVEMDKKEQKEYFIKNIRPFINSNIDSEDVDFESLSWSELKSLSERHAIGCHTYSHTLTNQEFNPDNLFREIVYSKQFLENKLGITIDSFCSINNTLLSVNNEARKLINSNYKFHFTTFAGGNNPLNSAQIQRVNVESHWLDGAIKFAISKWEMKRWKSKIKTYNNN